MKKLLMLLVIISIMFLFSCSNIIGPDLNEKDKYIEWEWKLIEQDSLYYIPTITLINVKDSIITVNMKYNDMGTFPLYYFNNDSNFIFIEDYYCDKNTIKCEVSILKMYFKKLELQIIVNNKTIYEYILIN